VEIELIQDVEVSPNVRDKADVACAYPITQVLDNGDIACLYRRGKEKHSYDGVLVLQMSSDRGVTWSEPRVVFDGRNMQPAQGVVTGAVCQTGQGDLLVNASLVDASKPDVYLFSKEGMTFNRWLYTVRSVDGGKTWRYPEPFSPAPFEGVGIITNPFLLPDGALFMPLAAQTEYGPLGTAGRLSHDGGRTFGPLSMCLADPEGELNFCDSYYTTLRNNEVLSLIWTFRHDNSHTINLHQSISKDNGRTWSPPVDTGMCGETCAPLALSSGTVIAAASYRQLPEGIRLYMSTDGGTTWDVDHPMQMWDDARGCVLGQPAVQVADELKREDIWQALTRYSFGTPNLVELDDNSVLLMYYAMKENRYHIRACRFRVADASE